MNNSKFLNLKWGDIGKGLFVFVAIAVLGSLQQGLETHGINFAAYDWAGILDLAVKAAGAYIGTQLFSDENGKVLGKIG